MNSTIAVALWVVGAAVIMADLMRPNDDLGHLGLMFVIGGATLNVRHFMCRQAQDINNAFEVGRDAGRLEVVPPQRIR